MYNKKCMILNSNSMLSKSISTVINLEVGKGQLIER